MSHRKRLPAEAGSPRVGCAQRPTAAASSAQCDCGERCTAACASRSQHAGEKTHHHRPVAPLLKLFAYSAWRQLWAKAGWLHFLQNFHPACGLRANPHGSLQRADCALRFWKQRTPTRLGAPLLRLVISPLLLGAEGFTSSTHLPWAGASASLSTQHLPYYRFNEKTSPKRRGGIGRSVCCGIACHTAFITDGGSGFVPQGPGHAR